MDWKRALHTDLSILLRRGWPIHERYERRGRVWHGYYYRRKAAWQKDLTAVTSQLASIVECNAPLLEGLSYAAASAPNAKVQDVLIAMRAGITRGQSLSEVMEVLSRFFPRYYVDLVKSGEDSGTLTENLHRLIRLNRQTITATRTIRGWVIYLTFMLSAQLFILAFLFTFIVPQFVEVFRDFNSALPEPIRTISRVQDFLVSPVVSTGKRGLEGLFESRTGPLAGVVFKLSLPLSVFIAFVLLRYQPFWTARRTGRREWIRRCFRWIPIWRSIDAKLSLSHATGVLQQLLAAGMPLDKALQSCAQLDIGSRLQGVFLRLRDRVSKGISLSDALSGERGLPKSLMTMAALGETSGLLPETLERISNTYERQALVSARVVADTMAPLVVIVAGCVTLLVTLSVHMGTVGIIESMLDTL